MKYCLAQALPGLMDGLRFERAIAQALAAMSLAVVLPEVVGLGFTFRLVRRILPRTGQVSQGCRCLIMNAGCSRLAKVHDSACTAPTVRKKHPVGQAHVNKE